MSPETYDDEQIINMKNNGNIQWLISNKKAGN